MLQAVAARGSLRLWWFAAAFLFTALSLGNALVWEPAHDEGVTWTQAFGPMLLPGCDSPTSVASLYPSLDADGPRSAGDVLAALVRDGMHPPAYYLLVHAWASWVGTERVLLSLPAIAIGVLSLLAMGRLAGALAPGRGSQAWGMFLLACSPWFVGYSVFARPYGLVLLATLWSTLALLEMHGGNRGPRLGRARLFWQASFVAASCLGLYSLYHYVFVLVWQGAALLCIAWQSGDLRKRELVSIGAMGAAVVCLYAPWLSSLALHLGVAGSSPYYFAGWVALADWPQKWGHLLQVFALGEGLWSTHAAGLRGAAAALGLITLPLALRSLSPAKLRTLVPAARILWTTAPLLPLAILASDWVRETHTLFISKTTFSFLPILILLALRGWLELPRRGLATVGLSACVLLAGAATLSAIETRGRFLTSFEVVAEYLRRTDSPSHRVVLSSQRRGYTIPFMLTLREAGVANVQIALAPSEARGEHEKLEGCAQSLLTDPHSQRVTLVDFKVPYESRGTWQPEALARLAKSARSLGWRHAPLAAGDPEVALRARNDRFWQRGFTGLAGDPRVLVIASPTKAKYFSE